jgi:hypothetical protein
LDLLQYYFGNTGIESHVNWKERAKKRESLEEVQAFNIELAFWDKFKQGKSKLRPRTLAMIEQLYDIQLDKASSVALDFSGLPEPDALFAQLWGLHKAAAAREQIIDELMEEFDFRGYFDENS